jgi:opacity protein-like surface antigen
MIASFTSMRLVFLALFLATPGLSLAQVGSNQDPIKGFYLGGGIGVSTLYSQEDEWWDADSETGDPGFTYALTGGYRFSRYFGVEVSYFDGSDLDWDDGLIRVRAPPSPLVDDTYRIDADVELSSFQLSGLAILPFANTAEVYVRGGLSFWDADSDLTFTTAPAGVATEIQNSDDGVGFVIGVGGGVSVTKNLHLRLDYNMYELDEDVLGLGSTDYDAYVSSLTFQALYRFGDAWPGR